ncbi:hypothetical protein D3C76_1568810 [compost metagenome]
MVPLVGMVYFTAAWAFSAARPARRAEFSISTCMALAAISPSRKLISSSARPAMILRKASLVWSTGPILRFSLTLIHSSWVIGRMVASATEVVSRRLTRLATFLKNACCE